MKQSLKKIVIFGVGLIGGSFALALKSAGLSSLMVGVGRNNDNLRSAINLGVIDEVQNDIEKAIHEADLIFIATPVAQTPLILNAIAPHLSSKTIVTDAGSTKSDIQNYVITASDYARDKKSFLSNFIGGHPIAGSEKSGVNAANPDLFKGKNVILTPNSDTSDETLRVVKSLWEATGAAVTEMSAQKHDQIFAAVSHLPHILSFALVANIASRSNSSELFDFAASGFRDFTRIAGSSPEMWRDICLANGKALYQELESYKSSLEELSRLISNKDGSGLEALFSNASIARNQWNEKKKTTQDD